MRRRFSALAASLGLLAILAASRGDDAKPTTTGKPGLPFRIAMDVDMKVSTAKGSSRVRGQSDFDYRLMPKGRTVETAVDRMSLTQFLNGREVNFTDMSRNGIVTREGDKTETQTRDKLNPRAVAMLDQYESPLAVITLDAEGTEVSRELKIKSGPLIDFNAIEITRVFHPRFARTEKAWDAPVVIPLGDRRLARGTLHYTKQAEPRKGGLVGVDVEGEMAVTGKMKGAEVKKGTYVVKGEQTYDPALGQWVAGRLTIETDFEAVLPDGAVIKGGGPVIMLMNRIDPTEAPRRSTP
jgi:hypothetical protein